MQNSHIHIYIRMLHPICNAAYAINILMCRILGVIGDAGQEQWVERKSELIWYDTNRYYERPPMESKAHFAIAYNKRVLKRVKLCPNSSVLRMRCSWIFRTLRLRARGTSIRKSRRAKLNFKNLMSHCRDVDSQWGTKNPFFFIFASRVANPNRRSRPSIAINRFS